MTNYVDPGTGTFILQMAIATVIGLGYSVRRWVARLFGVPAPAAIADDAATKLPGSEV